MFENVNFVYVEDEPLNRKVMEILLLNGLQVKHLAIFHDGYEFIHRLQELSFAPDVILLDIHIEPYSGFELLEQVRADGTFSQSKIVAVTASLRVEELRMIREHGFDGVIAKPISMHTFPNYIQHILDGQPIWDTQ